MFDHEGYVTQHHEKLLLSSEGRRVLCEQDPLLFALIYLRHHLASPETGGGISFSQFHLDFYERARQWARKDIGTAEMRDCWVAPRGSGKSTLAFLATPLWALAYGHRRYVMAFADSTTQAEQHLSSLKRELDTNELLRRDFPELCKAMRRRAGDTLSDNRALYVATSGVAMMAKGIDSSSLGAKIGSQRPDLLLFDDIEPDESNYSQHQKEKRLSTVIDAVFAMNPNAAVCMVGTVTMPGSIVHDVVKQVTAPVDAPSWPGEENITPRYYNALQVQEDGSELSLWPERWTTEYLLSIRHTRSYQKNYANDPMGRDGAFWTSDDFKYGELNAITRMAIFVDPAVTTRKTSDFTGIAVVGYSAFTDNVIVEHAEGVKLMGAPLRQRILSLIARYPKTQRVYVESNQAGDLWMQVLHDMPVRVVTYTAKEAKEVRFADALEWYQRGKVLHSRRLSMLEEQAVVFPKGANDDVLDAACAGVNRFLSGRRKVKVAVTNRSYV